MMEKCGTGCCSAQRSRGGLPSSSKREGAEKTAGRSPVRVPPQTFGVRPLGAVPVTWDSAFPDSLASLFPFPQDTHCSEPRFMLPDPSRVQAHHLERAGMACPRVFQNVWGTASLRCVRLLGVRVCPRPEWLGCVTKLSGTLSCLLGARHGTKAGGLRTPTCLGRRRHPPG